MDQSGNDLGAVSLIPASAAEGRNTHFPSVIGVGRRLGSLAMKDWPHLPADHDKMYGE
jgi:hypothetical protein